MDNPKVIIGLLEGGEQKGLFATQHIFPEEEIATFDGKVSSWDPCCELTWEQEGFDRDHAIQFHPFKCRDSIGFARYANHSCEPNCGIKELFRIVAMRDIIAGEEISWDYAMSENDDWEMVCDCGERSCQGVVRGFRFLSREKRDAYVGFLSGWHFDPYIGESVVFQDEIKEIQSPHTLQSLTPFNR